MVRGTPFLRKVAGLGEAEPKNRLAGEVGNEDEIIGLSVSRLWSKGFLDGVDWASSGIALVAASDGVRIRPEDVEGSNLRACWTTSRFWRCRRGAGFLRRWDAPLGNDMISSSTNFDNGLPVPSDDEALALASSLAAADNKDVCTIRPVFRRYAT
jgi:hypothetical protein